MNSCPTKDLLAQCILCWTLKLCHGKKLHTKNVFDALENVQYFPTLITMECAFMGHNIIFYWWPRPSSHPKGLMNSAVVQKCTMLNWTWENSSYSVCTDTSSVQQTSFIQCFYTVFGPIPSPNRFLHGQVLSLVRAMYCLLNTSISFYSLVSS